MPTVLVGAKVDEKPNFMTAAWCGIAASKPPAISVGLQKVRHTLKIEWNFYSARHKFQNILPSILD